MEKDVSAETLEVRWESEPESITRESNMRDLVDISVR